MKTRRIGTIELLKSKTFRDASYECAAWWREIECNPQAVDLMYSDHIGGEIVFTFYGKRKDDYFGALYCGVPISSKPYVSREVGRDDSYTRSTYAYNLIGLLHNPDYRIVLDPDVQVVGEIKVLGERETGWAHTAVFARISEVSASVS